MVNGPGLVPAQVTTKIPRGLDKPSGLFPSYPVFLHEHLPQLIQGGLSPKTLNFSKLNRKRGELGEIFSILPRPGWPHDLPKGAGFFLGDKAYFSLPQDVQRSNYLAACFLMEVPRKSMEGLAVLEVVRSGVGIPVTCRSTHQNTAQYMGLIHARRKVLFMQWLHFMPGVPGHMDRGEYTHTIVHLRIAANPKNLDDATRKTEQQKLQGLVGDKTGEAAGGLAGLKKL